MTPRYVGDVADDVDLTVLSDAERAEYARLVRGGHRLPIGAAIWCGIATLGLLAVAFVSSSNWQDTLIDDIAGWSGIGVGLVGTFWVWTLFQDAANIQKERAQDVTRYLRQIDYYRRRDRRHADGDASDDDGYESKSRRQMQHEWYGDHSELDWHDRVLGEALGFDDADTYVSNFLEHDKD